jgi:hypothetical protein
LVIAFRIIMIFDVVPVKAIVKRFHTWNNWPQQLKEVAKGTPIVFTNSYQRASQAWFYTGTPAYSLNSYQERRSNYNFWPIEDSLLGKPVYIMDIYGMDRFYDSIKARIWTVGYKYDSSFQSFARVMLKPGQNKYSIGANESLTLQLKVQMPDYYKTYLQQHLHIDKPVKVGVFQKRDWIKDVETPLTLQQIAKQPQIQLSLPLQLPKGEYFLRIAIGTSFDVYTHNSDKIPITVH